MSRQIEFTFDQPNADADLLYGLMERADKILVKKLSNNDREWAIPKLDEEGRRTGKWMNNQAGPYIPKEQRDSGFFLPLELMERTDGGKDEIRVRWVQTLWPQVDNERKKSRLVNYRSKGEETHLTRLPKAAFGDLSPASFLIIGRLGEERLQYECLTLDSESPETELLTEILDLGPDFQIGIFRPSDVRDEERDRVLDFAEQVIAAWQKGELAEFAQTHAAMPVTAELARMARESWLKANGLERINPFALANPGDVLRDLSRKIEWDLFRDYQRRERAVELVRLILGDAPGKFDATSIIRKLVDELPKIDAMMLSASQQRKSRAGYSYEHHIEAMLEGGNIPFQKQVIVEARKRPDFILPSLKWIDSGKPDSRTGLILSAKTTLRERWKQVEREKGGRRLFLTTVDENIAGNAIEDMASFGVQLVIPESLLKSNLAIYSRHENVLGFRDFCDRHVQLHLENWRP